MPVLWLSFVVIFQADWADTRWAALIATIGLLPALWTNMSAWFLNGLERFVAGSAVIAVTQFLTGMGLVVLVAFLGQGLTGGLLATALGAVLAAALGGVLVSRAGLRLRPTWDTEYFRIAAPNGLSVGASHLLTVGLVRADLVFVYLLAGSASAGHYSVALAVGLLALMPPIAMSVGTFPRLANLPQQQADQLIAKVFRFSILAVFVTSFGLAVATPIFVPFAFGKAFRPAVLPSLIVLAGGVPWTAQWILSRAQAARGRTSMHLKVVGLSLAVMCLLDLFAVRRFGILGAAGASSIAPVVGSAYCLWVYRRAEWWPHPMALLLPSTADVRALSTNFFRLIRSRA